MEITTLLQNPSRWCYLNVFFVPKTDIHLAISALWTNNRLSIFRTTLIYSMGL